MDGATRALVLLVQAEGLISQQTPTATDEQLALVRQLAEVEFVDGMPEHDGRAEVGDLLSYVNDEDAREWDLMHFWVLLKDAFETVQAAVELDVPRGQPRKVTRLGKNFADLPCPYCDYGALSDMDLKGHIEHAHPRRVALPLAAAGLQAATVALPTPSPKPKASPTPKPAPSGKSGKRPMSIEAFGELAERAINPKPKASPDPKAPPKPAPTPKASTLAGVDKAVRVAAGMAAPDPTPKASPAPKPTTAPEASPAAPDPKASPTLHPALHVPQPDPTFHVDTRTVRLLLAVGNMRKRGEIVNVLLTGHKGTGKTSLPSEFAASWGAPIFIQPCQLIAERDDWWGSQELSPEKGTYFSKAAFLDAVETPGCVVLLDEANRTHPENINALFGFLDHRRSAYVPQLKREVHVAEGVVFFVTLNEGFSYVGTSPIDEALRDRMTYTIRMTYVPTQVEAEIISTRTGVDEGTAGKLAEFANAVRSDPKLEIGISTRQLLGAATLVKDGMALNDAVLFAVVNGLGEDVERQTLMQALQIVGGVEDARV